MAAGSFVRRIGGLAIALGVAAAITEGPVAWAEADESRSASSSGSGTSAGGQTSPSSPATSTTSTESPVAETATSVASKDPKKVGGDPGGTTGRHGTARSIRDRVAAEAPTAQRSVHLVGTTAPLAGDAPADGGESSPVEVSRAGPDPALTAADKADHGDTHQTTQAAADHHTPPTAISPTRPEPGAVPTSIGSPVGTTDSTHDKEVTASSETGTTIAPATSADAQAIVADPTPVTEASVANSAALAADLLSTVAGTLNPFWGHLPSAAEPSPSSLELLALARRETVHTATVTATSSAAIRSAVDSVTARGTERIADAHPNSSSTEVQQMTPSESSFAQNLFVAGLQIVKAIGGVFGVDLFGVTAPLLAGQSPPWYTTFGLDARRTEFDGWRVWTLSSPNSTSDDQVLVLHGGGYILEPTVFGWLNYASIARDTGAKVVVPIYPLAPQATAATVVPQTADLMSKLIALHGSDKVSVYADSAGAGLALAATQELVRRHTETPSRMVLVSPWLDVTLSDPASESINDPILTASGLRGAGLQWAGDLDATNPLVSPLFGSLDGLPPITIYSGSQDLLSPDTLRLQQRAVSEGVDIDVHFLNGGLHGWPGFFFLPEAIAALPAIEQALVPIG